MLAAVDERTLGNGLRALAVAAGVAVASPLVVAPVGFAWLPVIMVLKLVVAHAVPRDLEPHPEGAARVAD